MSTPGEQRHVKRRRPHATAESKVPQARGDGHAVHTPARAQAYKDATQNKSLHATNAHSKRQLRVRRQRNLEGHLAARGSACICLRFGRPAPQRQKIARRAPCNMSCNAPTAWTASCMERRVTSTAREQTGGMGTDMLAPRSPELRNGETGFLTHPMTGFARRQLRVCVAAFVLLCLLRMFVCEWCLLVRALTATALTARLVGRCFPDFFKAVWIFPRGFPRRGGRGAPMRGRGVRHLLRFSASLCTSADFVFAWRPGVAVARTVARR
jgi:hypothetical protein